jgi:CBS domain-containing protein
VAVPGGPREHDEREVDMDRKNLRAKDIMTADVVSVRTDTDLRELKKILVEHGISGAPVVDDSGRLVGMVCYPLADPVPGTVGEVMTPSVVTADPEASVEDLARLMMAPGVHRVVIVRDGIMVGMVSAMDLLTGIPMPSTTQPLAA